MYVICMHAASQVPNVTLKSSRTFREPSCDNAETNFIVLGFLKNLQSREASEPEAPSLTV